MFSYEGASFQYCLIRESVAFIERKKNCDSKIIRKLPQEFCRVPLRKREHHLAAKEWSDAASVCGFPFQPVGYVYEHYKKYPCRQKTSHAQEDIWVCSIGDTRMCGEIKGYGSSGGPL